MLTCDAVASRERGIFCRSLCRVAGDSRGNFTSPLCSKVPGEESVLPLSSEKLHLSSGFKAPQVCPRPNPQDLLSSTVKELLRCD